MLLFINSVTDKYNMEISSIELFGLKFQIEEITIDDLPLYLTAQRSFYRLSYQDNNALLIKISSDEKFGTMALEKQAVIFSEKFNMPTAFWFDNVTKAQRNSLIARNIPFISGSEQIYLPFLGMALSNRFRQMKIVNTNKMMPATQELFLYMLYKSNGKPVLKMNAAKAVGITKTSVTRASRQLEAMGLIAEEVRGKEHCMITNGMGLQLYEKAKPHLINPIQKIITIHNTREYDNCPLSGESALAKQTMLGNPQIITRAIDKSVVSLENITEIDIRWTQDKSLLNLELWKYNPALFMKNGVVDPISLSLTFENNVDERIEEAIEEYLEQYEW